MNVFCKNSSDISLNLCILLASITLIHASYYYSLYRYYMKKYLLLLVLYTAPTNFTAASHCSSMCIFIDL